MLFNNFYQGKKVLVTGHTGFKGSWLCYFLKMLGADVAGLSRTGPDNIDQYFKEGKRSIEEVLRAKAVFELLDGENPNPQQTRNFAVDIKDEKAIHQVIDTFQPEIVFHLAAQPIVLTAYENPMETILTNFNGTLFLLEAIRMANCVKSIVVITTDKCYENLGQPYDFKPDDPLGGRDPYSVSKTMVEYLVHCYRNSYFNKMGISIASARAGNVIGGNDWANRMVPNLVKVLATQDRINSGLEASDNNLLTIRYPRSTRPWQHVLEPLSGYLWLGAVISNEQESWLRISHIAEGAFNFGPSFGSEAIYQLVNDICHKWGTDIKINIENRLGIEQMLLGLNNTMTRSKLRWSSVLDYQQTLNFITRWYKPYLNQIDFNCENKAIHYIHVQTKTQIQEFIQLAQQQKCIWTLDNVTNVLQNSHHDISLNLPNPQSLVPSDQLMQTFSNLNPETSNNLPSLRLPVLQENNSNLQVDIRQTTYSTTFFRRPGLENTARSTASLSSSSNDIADRYQAVSLETDAITDAVEEGKNNTNNDNSRPSLH